MGLSVNVSDSNSKSPALKRPIDAVVGTARMNKDSPVKDIWLIRHGESEHNTASDWGIRDPGLTDQGWRQAKALKHEPLLKGALGQYEGTEQMASTSPFINLTRKSPFSHDFNLQVELILVSPLRRTLQTAQAISEIMRSLNAAKSQKVPIIAVSDLQETSDSPCDTGHPAHVLGAEFPEVDFGSVAEDWFDKQAKWNYSTADRVTRFSEWIASRPERTILCIGHLDFFHQLVGVRLVHHALRERERERESASERAGRVIHRICLFV
jgi:broad specificity phosphatase PhoE